VRVTASGDLYERQFSSNDGEFAPAPKPESGIPILPRTSYRYYLRVTDVFEQDNSSFRLVFEAIRFSVELVKLRDLEHFARHRLLRRPSQPKQYWDFHQPERRLTTRRAGDKALTKKKVV
jgi:hypothetical protein